jgi:hypothetical protein
MAFPTLSGERGSAVISAIPSHVWEFTQLLFWNKLRSDRATCRCSLRSAPGGTSGHRATLCALVR